MQPFRPPHPTQHPGPKPVAECVSLDALAGRARMLDALDERLRRFLPETLARECRLADLRDGRLVFLTSSASWATRLRLHEAGLLAEARIARGDRIDRLVVKVAAPALVPHEPPAPKPLSSVAAGHLLAAAESITDPEIRSMYLKLAALAEPPIR